MQLSSQHGKPSVHWKEHLQRFCCIWRASLESLHPWASRVKTWMTEPRFWLQILPGHTWHQQRTGMARRCLLFVAPADASQHFTAKERAPVHNTALEATRVEQWDPSRTGAMGCARYALTLLGWKDQVSRYHTIKQSHLLISQPCHRVFARRGCAGECKHQPRPQLRCEPAIRSLADEWSQYSLKSNKHYPRIPAARALGWSRPR